jgi:hypothetical protein
MLPEPRFRLATIAQLRAPVQGSFATLADVRRNVVALKSFALVDHAAIQQMHKES